MTLISGFATLWTEEDNKKGFSQMKHIVVIGGGILGSSTSFHLANQGMAVTQIDENHLGKATDAAAGIVCPWLSKRRNQAWYQLVKAGAAYYPELIQKLANNGQHHTGYKRSGALWLHDDSRSLTDALERVKTKRLDAPEIGELALLNSEQVQEQFPPLAKRFGAVHVGGAARVDGRALNHSLQEAAKNHGAKHIKGKATLLRSQTNALTVCANDKPISCDGIVIAAGAWAKELLEPIGLKIEVKEQKAQIVHLQTNADTSNWPVIIPPGNQYLLAFEGGKIVAGATHEDDTNFNSAVTAGGMHDIFNKLLDIAPGLSEAEWTETRVGFRPVVPHFLPVFGELPNFQNVWFANGLGSSGLTTGPYIGALLANLISGQSSPFNRTSYDVSSIM